MKLHGASYNCCIHSEEECTMLVECARNGLIKKVNQRLSDVEKKGIRPGDIFIYTEDEAQIIRWTDKKTWTPSRVQGIFLTYKDLSGPFIKKTYTCILGSERHRIVAYALAKWEETGDCCLHFIDKIEELHRLASKIGLWVNRKNSFTKGFRSGSSIKGMPLLEQSRRDGGVLLGESRYNGGSFTYSPNGESISKIEFGKNTNSLNQRMYLDDEILQTFNDTSTIEQMKNHQNDKYISQFEACDMNKCGYTNECQIEDNYRGYCEDKRLDNGKYIGESYKASYYSDDQAE
ncbi:Gti1/Pac2 family transcription factor, partial [Pancytospora epiphaga]